MFRADGSGRVRGVLQPPPRAHQLLSVGFQLLRRDQRRETGAIPGAVPEGPAGAGTAQGGLREPR